MQPIKNIYRNYSGRIKPILSHQILSANNYLPPGNNTHVTGPHPLVQFNLAGAQRNVGIHPDAKPRL